MSLLHFAAMNRKPHNTEMLRTLLQKDTNVNSIAKDNTIPLDFAASTGIHDNCLLSLTTEIVYYWFDSKIFL